MQTLPQFLPSAEMGTAQQEIPVIYVVEEQQATWLFASLSEAKAFDRQRAEYHRYSLVREYQGRLDSFNSEAPDVPLEFGPGQDNCKRLQRKVHRWWKARDAWWESF